MCAQCFCAISTGIYEFPKDLAAEVALRTVREWLNTGTNAHKVALCESLTCICFNNKSCLQVRKIVFSCYDPADIDAYYQMAKVFFPVTIPEEDETTLEIFDLVDSD